MHALPYILLQRIRQAAIDARRRDRTWRYVAWSVVAGIANAAMLTLASMLVWLFWIVGWWWFSVAVVAVLIGPILADAVVRFVLVPAGAHRLAYVTALYSRPGADPAAYALCAAAAASQGGTATTWVEARRDRRQPLGDGEVVATALLTAARGDADTARALLRSIPMLVENHPAVRELAGEWLACDAAERSAWHAIVDDARRTLWPATPLTYLLEGIAARHTMAAGAPGAIDLWGRWLLAPRRRVTFALVVEALAVAQDAPAAPVPTSDPAEPHDDAAPSPAPSPAVDPTMPLPRAVAAHLAFEAAEPEAAALALAVEAWDAAFADARTQSWLARRALELDAPAGAVERAIDDVAGAVTDQLARRAEAAQLGAPARADGPVGRLLTRRLRHGRLDALEAGFARWAERRHDRTPHPAIDEWREFVALRNAYDAAVAAGGLELRRLAFPHAFSKGSNMAAWLWNKREEYAVSHAISAWLLDEARIVGDTEAIELGHRNCGLAVPTRLGSIQAPG